MIQITGDGPKIIFLDCGIVAEANNKHEALINVLHAMLKFDGRAAGRLMLVESNREGDPGYVLLADAVRSCFVDIFVYLYFLLICNYLSCIICNISVLKNSVMAFSKLSTTQRISDILNTVENMCSG